MSERYAFFRNSQSLGGKSDSFEAAGPIYSRAESCIAAKLNVLLQSVNSDKRQYAQSRTHPETHRKPHLGLRIIPCGRGAERGSAANRYISLTDKPGDEKEVFLYHDSEDRLVATTETPLLRVGEAGYLRVVDKTAHGAFLDWGLYGKDLFLPNRNQQGGIIAGRSYIVYLYEDSVTGRCVATCKLKSFINNDIITVAPRQEVDLLVASESPIGYRVIINNRHWGMLYRNQLFRPIAVGDRTKGYVRKLTEDNRIDVSLQQEGFAQVKDSAEVLLQLVRDNGGFLPLNDDSAPEEVNRLTQTSKKVFKRSLGMLLKRGAVTVDEQGIKINE